jgi:hypothetical protein
MKDVYEILRQKELEVSKLQKEVDALRVAAPLLSEDNEAEDYNQSTRASAAAQQLIEDLQANDTPQQARSAWGDRAKHWLSRQAPDSGENP